MNFKISNVGYTGIEGMPIDAITLVHVLELQFRGKPDAMAKY
ncbi:MAG: hypothetical protein RMX62_05860 [Planktomarina sp.]|nr:hypothetical protein [Planktomarina sp.]